MTDPIIMDAKKTLCMIQLVNELPVLRARLNLSQEEVADRIGVSRQTYNSIESKRRNMNWNTCIALVTLFAGNEKTRKMMDTNSSLLELLNEVLIV
jgi:DNA-binding XRE family transcriptional regulator